jgi:hypothetical protein
LNINVCGRREEGKTTLAMYLARQRHTGIVVFDPRGMIQGVVVYGPDELRDAIERRAWEKGPLVYRYDGADHKQEFANVTEILFPPRFPVGGFAFIIDEAGLLQGPNSIDENLARVVKQHPTFPARESVTVIQTNHRLAEFHGASKALMNELYIFQTTHPGDLEKLSEHTDGEQAIAEAVKTLPRHHCVRYKYGRQAEGVSQWELWNDPHVWFVQTTGPETGKKGLDIEDGEGVEVVDSDPWSELRIQ